MTQPLVQLLGDMQVLHIAPDASVERLEDGRISVSRPGEAVNFDLDAPVYAFGPPAWFAQQLRRAASY